VEHFARLNALAAGSVAATGEPQHFGTAGLHWEVPVIF
jgi:hypothetical protein